MGNLQRLRRRVKSMAVFMMWEKHWANFAVADATPIVAGLLVGSEGRLDARTGITITGIHPDLVHIGCQSREIDLASPCRAAPGQEPV